MRSVWLALICLASLVALFAIKMGTAPLATADVGESEAATSTEQVVSKTKADRLEIFRIEPTPDKTAVMSVPIVSSKAAPESAATTTKIIGRHWHDPLAPKAPPLAKLSKGRSSKAQ